MASISFFSLPLWNSKDREKNDPSDKSPLKWCIEPKKVNDIWTLEWLHLSSIEQLKNLIGSKKGSLCLYECVCVYICIWLVRRKDTCFTWFTDASWLLLLAGVSLLQLTVILYTIDNWFDRWWCNSKVHLYLQFEWLQNKSLFMVQEEKVEGWGEYKRINVYMLQTLQDKKHFVLGSSCLPSFHQLLVVELRERGNKFKSCLVVHLRVFQLIQWS